MRDDYYPRTQKGHQRKCQLIVPAPGHDQEDGSTSHGGTHSNCQTVQLTNNLIYLSGLRIRWKNEPGEDTRRTPLRINRSQDFNLEHVKKQRGKLPPVGISTIGIINPKPSFLLDLQVPLGDPSFDFPNVEETLS